MRSTRSPRSATPSPPLPTTAITMERVGAPAVAAAAADPAVFIGAGGFISLHLGGLLCEFRPGQLPDSMQDEARTDVDASLVARRPVGHALLVIDLDRPAVPLDGSGRALGHALAAEDAAHHAGGPHDRLLVPGHARQLHAVVPRVELEQVLGTHGHADAAARALRVVHHGDSLAADGQGVERAGAHAVAEAQAAVLAGLRPAEDQRGRGARLHPGVYRLLPREGAGAHAAHDHDAVHDRAHLLARQLRERLRHGAAPGGAQVDRHVALLHQRLGVGLAPRVAAGPAVGRRERRAHPLHQRVHGHLEAHRDGRQREAEEDAEQREDRQAPERDAERRSFHPRHRMNESPEKPMKARANSPAIANAIGSPSKLFGTRASSSFSRAQAMRKSAIANPAPEPRARAKDSPGPDSAAALSSGTARMMQFVVISMRYTPHFWWSERCVFLRIVSSACTRNATTPMNTMIWRNLSLSGIMTNV